MHRTFFGDLHESHFADLPSRRRDAETQSRISSGQRSRRAVCASALKVCLVFFIAVPAFGQVPVMERVTFDEAIQRALQNNPTIAQAAQGILRAEALLQQTRAQTMPNVSVVFSNAVLDTGRAFDGVVIQPRSQSTLSANVSVPVLAASRWAATTHARDQIEVAQLSSADARQEIAVATGQTYLSIIAARRQVEVSMRARETAIAHLDYAQRRLKIGAGTRLNELRAAQEVATNEARLENAQLGVRRAQEALGVLIVSNGPVDAVAEPVFELPPVVDEPAWMAARPDVRLFTATERATERVWRNSFKDYFPTAVASFDPQGVTPAGAFAPSRSWRFVLSFSQPVFDGGERRGLSRFRLAAVESSRLALRGLQIQARSEVRLAQETLQSSERALASLRLAAQQATEVLSITNTAFEAGATTNIEVIDAQRSARDAESAAAIAEDAVRRARLDLLTALGRFPQ
jgi:outer membrane protein TolC